MDPDRAAQDEYAVELHNLANRLSESGRRAEAVAPAAKAVAIRRQLAEGNPGVFLPGLGGSGSNLATLLAGVGRWTESLAYTEAAVEAMEEAVDIWDQLAQAFPDEIGPRLLSALSTLAELLDEVSRGSEAARIRSRIEGPGSAE